MNLLAPKGKRGLGVISQSHRHAPHVAWPFRLLKYLIQTGFSERRACRSSLATAAQVSLSPRPGPSTFSLAPLQKKSRGQPSNPGHRHTTLSLLNETSHAAERAKDARMPTLYTPCSPMLFLLTLRQTAQRLTSVRMFAIRPPACILKRELGEALESRSAHFFFRR